MLAPWYREHGRHELPWRASRDRWTVLVSEVMLHQTQVPRVAAVFDAFIAEFPTPAATAAAGPAAVITAWGSLGYPRRARRLWESSVLITRDGWPADLSELPGVGRYTAAAVAAQVDDDDRVGIEVNIRRVCERVRGTRLSDVEAESCVREIATGLPPRDRLLAMMDLGATVCTARAVVRSLPDRVALRDARHPRRRNEAPAGTLRRIVPSAPGDRDGAATRRSGRRGRARRKGARVVARRRAR